MQINTYAIAVGTNEETVRLSAINVVRIKLVVFGTAGLLAGLGVLIITVLQTGRAQIGASEASKRVITGLVIIAAVIVDVYRNRSRGLGEYLLGLLKPG